MARKGPGHGLRRTARAKKGGGVDRRRNGDARKEGNVLLAIPGIVIVLLAGVNAVCPRERPRENRKNPKDRTTWLCLDPPCRSGNRGGKPDAFVKVVCHSRFLCYAETWPSAGVWKLWKRFSSLPAMFSHGKRNLWWIHDFFFSDKSRYVIITCYYK